jgi:hypothetical protein
MLWTVFGVRFLRYARLWVRILVPEIWSRDRRDGGAGRSLDRSARVDSYVAREDPPADARRGATARRRHADDTAGVAVLTAAYTGVRGR